MKKTLFLLNSFLLVLLFVGLVLVNNQLLGRFRVDLTENKVFTLSEGTKEVLASLDEPVTIYYFFSDTASKGMTSLRNYANRVETLLKEYEQASNGKLSLKVVDPVPFSESEDQASQFGLTGATLGSIGEVIYFGIAGTNALDDQFVLPFFDPQKEQFLEYDLTKLIYQLSQPEPVSITILTDLPVAGGQNPMTGQFDQPMVFYTQLSGLYDVNLIGSDADDLPSNTDVLLVVHPNGLSEELLRSIDQYAMNAGRVMLFVDPHYESDPMAMMAAQGANTSAIELLEKWGVAFDAEHVVLDADLGLDIRSAQGGVVRHPGILGLVAENLDRQDVITANLEVINGASFGSLSLTSESSLTMTPLLKSSAFATLFDAETYATTQDPIELQRALGDEVQYVLAARFNGQAISAYEAPEVEDDTEIFTNEVWQSSTQALNLLVVTDADLLADRFWVQQTSFFGETLFTPFANNGDFVNNASENLSGSEALISIRSRGTFARPFTVVQQLEREAEAKFLAQEEKLQEELAQTEAQLLQLQNQYSDTGNLTISPEQQKAIDEFVSKRVTIRKALRDVRYQLERDIDELGNWLKFINIAVAPLSLLLVLYLLRLATKRRAGRLYMEDAS